MPHTLETTTRACQPTACKWCGQVSRFESKKCLTHGLHRHLELSRFVLKAIPAARVQLASKLALAEVHALAFWDLARLLQLSRDTVAGTTTGSNCVLRGGHFASRNRKDPRNGL